MAGVKAALAAARARERGQDVTIANHLSYVAMQRASLAVCQAILKAASSAPMRTDAIEQLIETACKRPGADFVRICVKAAARAKTTPKLSLSTAASGNIAALDYLLTVVKSPRASPKVLAQSRLLNVPPHVTTWIIDRLAEEYPVTSIASPILKRKATISDDSVRSIATTAMKQALFVLNNNGDSTRALLAHPLLQPTIKEDLPTYIDAAINQAMTASPKLGVSPTLLPIADKMLAIGCPEMLDDAIRYAIRGRHPL